MLEIAIPGRETIRARHLLLDINGTLSCDGALLPGVEERLARLRAQLSVILLTADTFGTAETLGERLGVPVRRLAGESGGLQKLALVRELGPAEVIAIGNGDNDARMLEAAALGIAVVQTEGAAVSALLRADVVFTSILDALDALAAPARLAATLRK